MKKFNLIILFILLLPLRILAQADDAKIAEIWTQPAAFVPDDSVSWFFDVTGTQLEGSAPTDTVYMWSWYPSEPDVDNWSNSSSFAALTNVEGNIWRFDLVPTEYYSLPAASITEFYGRLKNKDGSKMSGFFAPDMTPPNQITTYNISQLDDVTMSYYPSEIKYDRPLSILVNANNTWSGCDATPVQGDLLNAATVHMHAGLNDWDEIVENNASNLAKTELADLGSGIYRIDLIIEDYFGYADGYSPVSMEMIFADPDFTYEGKDEDCADFVIEFPIVLDPILTLIPQTVSKKDLLVVIRENNEAGVTGLSYTISDGATELGTGDFTGTSEIMTAYINLLSILDGVTASQITLTITDNLDQTKAELTLNLVDLEE